MSSKSSKPPDHPNNIRKAIKQSPLKFYEVVEETKIPRGTLNDYCAGKLPVPRARLDTLSQCLKCSTEYLVPPLPNIRGAYELRSESEETKDLEALLVLRTHCQQHPTDENALQQLLELLGKFGRYREIEEGYERFLKAVKQEDFWREPDACTSALLAQFRTQVSVSVSSLAPENVGQAARTNEVVSPETATHAQEASAPPKSDGPLSLVSPPSFNGSPQGIILVRGAHTLELDARNLRDSYLTSSTDIVPSLKAYSNLCRGELTICQQQIDIYAIIERRRTMNDEHITDLSQIGRRDLLTLAAISQPLLTNIQRGWLTAGIIEDFLSEATASVTTCWYLLQRSDGLPLVEFTLPQYLPELVEVVKFSPLHRKRASYLAAQGFLLLSLVAYHRVRFAEEIAHCQAAIMYAHESGDLTLLVESQRMLGSAFLDTGQLDKMLDAYLQTEHYSQGMDLPGFLCSKVQAKLSQGYAKHGRSQEVTRYLGEAERMFTEADDETPVFLLTTHGRFQIILEEGRSTLDLGNHEQDQGNSGRAQKYWKDAAEKFGKIGQLPSGILVPARINAEIEIKRAKAAALLGDMDEFIKRFANGVAGAKALRSDKQMQEAREAYIIARKRWLHEQRIRDLWELLI